jgi:hypothetical protein
MRWCDHTQVNSTNEALLSSERGKSCLESNRIVYITG